MPDDAIQSVKRLWELGSSPSTPPTSQNQIYPKSDGCWYYMGDDGVEHKILSGSNGRFNSLGGIDCKYTAGEALYKGEVVVPGSADIAVVKAPTSGDLHSMPIGAVSDDAASGADVWITMSGLGWLKPLAADTAVRGYVCVTSGTTAGRVDQASTVPSINTHMRECGHFAANGSGAGVATAAAIHFN